MLSTVYTDVPSSHLKESIHLHVVSIYYISQVNGHPPLRLRVDPP